MEKAEETVCKIVYTNLSAVLFLLTSSTAIPDLHIISSACAVWFLVVLLKSLKQSLETISLRRALFPILAEFTNSPKEVLELTNVFRRTYRLPDLVWNPNLSKIALQHSIGIEDGNKDI